MSMQTAPDVPLLVVSENSSSERRISPSWSISHLRARLEPITGVPSVFQKLSLRNSGQQPVLIQAQNEDQTTLSTFALAPYAEIYVEDTRPPGARPNYTDASGVEKYVMPEEEYAQKSDSVLAWKKANKLGRFNPEAPSIEQAKIAALQSEIDQRGIAVGRRCRVGEDDARRGVIQYVGDVPEIPGQLGPWVGIQLDEPVGKNDGSIGGNRYWGTDGGPKHGIFVRPDRVEAGDWPVIDDFEDMEEI